MKEETKLELEQDIRLLKKKYGLNYFSFCATTSDPENTEFLGIVGIGDETAGDFFESAMRVGRLWQLARENSRNLLNKYERSWK